MQIRTTRFGELEIDPLDVLLFPSGLIGFENSRHFVLLADERQPVVTWLQSVSEPELAFLAVSPRRFVRDYRLRVAQSDLAPLLQEHEDETFVLVLAAKHEKGWTLNLKAPLVINPIRRMGKQLVTIDEQSVQYAAPSIIGSLRKTA
jgi:flagellar assembly factor FliW